MTTSVIASAPSGSVVKSGPVRPPREPEVPKELLALADTPLFHAKYQGTERQKWTKGVPVFGTKLHSERQVQFTNDFNILRIGTPMIDYAAANLDDALRAAAHLAYSWACPEIGGSIDSSMAVAVLQAADGNYFMAPVGFGDPRTSVNQLGYRRDRFDNNIAGSPWRAHDTHATSSWSAPVDKHGKPVADKAPADAQRVAGIQVRDITLGEVQHDSAALKAIVDINNVYTVA